MKIKNIFVRLTAVTLIVAIGLPLAALADKIVEVDMRFAGTFATGIMHVNPMTGLVEPTALIHTQATGSLGRGESRGFGAADDPPVFTPDDCLGSSSPAGFLRILATEDPLVFTRHKDLSLLSANGSGEICIDLATGKTEFRFDITYIGGTGKFEGATGQAVIEGEAEPVSSDGSFHAETGTIVGWVNLPDGDDDDDDDDDDD